MSILSINSNAQSLAATHQIQRISAQQANTLTQLSTGYRINSAKDDPAGLIASELMRSDLTAANQAVKNTQRANGVLSIAESGMRQISTLLNEARGLAVESANTGAMNTAMLAANQLQIDGILASVNRISQTTQFLGKPLLDGSMSAENGGAVFQIGPQVVGSQQVTVDLPSVSTSNLGSEAGILAEIGTGGAASLLVNPAAADQILQSAIGEIAFKRGELGTVQKVTLDTNISFLQDYIVAVAGAEAAISNTDYAATISQQSRNQILLQTSIKALALTNSNKSLIASLLG